MKPRDKTFRRVTSAAIGAALFACVGTLAAEPVRLTSVNGGLTLVGQVIGYDGTYLQITSDHGPLSVNYARVTCEGVDCPEPANHVPVVRISGEARLTDILLPALIDGFARANGARLLATEEPGRNIYDIGIAKFAVQARSSAQGFEDLASYAADMVLALREPLAEERARAASAGIGQLVAAEQSVILGLDGLIPVVAPTQTVTTMSLMDLEKIFRGQITNWQELGGADQPIALHLGPNDEGQVQYLLDLLGAGVADTITHHADVAKTVAAVASSPGGLGVVSTSASGMAQPVTLRDTCGFVAVPRSSAIKAFDYALVSPLFLYLPEWRLHPVARDFITFLRSPAAQLIVRRARFVDQGIVPIPLDSQGQRFVSAIAAAGPEVTLSELQRMAAALRGLTRQSVSFRFVTGKTTLDAVSESQLRALAYAVKDGAYDGRSIWLIGFSDGRGDAATNKALAARRAESVAAEMTRLLGQIPEQVTLRTDAFGEALPMGCDDTHWGRQINRRVELWVSE